MLLKERELDHSKEQFHEALAVPEYMRTKCRERIFFSSFSNALQKEELFEDEEDAPKEMSTMTGDLQRCLKMIDNNLEYEFTLLNFISYQRMAMDAFSRYKYLNSKEKSKEDKLKLNIINLMEELRNKEENDEDDDTINDLSTNFIIKRIPLVKSSHYNFDIYLKQLTKEFNNDDSGDFNIDDFLKDIFN